MQTPCSTCVDPVWAAALLGIVLAVGVFAETVESLDVKVGESAQIFFCKIER